MRLLFWLLFLIIKVHFPYQHTKMEETMISDFHTHTEFSADSEAPITSQIERAIRLGMEELCITDHNDYDVAGGLLDFYLDIPTYVPRIQELQKQYEGRIKLRLGMELGLQLHIKTYLDQVVSDSPFDFIIGSSHFINGLDPFERKYFENRSEREAYEEYFRVSLKRIKELDCFDVMGHLDYIVRYGPNQNSDYSYRKYQDYIDPILRTLIDRGQGIECNTGGYKYGLEQPNPCLDILKRYRELGGEILTVGSDAHDPRYIGYEFNRAREALSECGFRYYTVYSQRKPEFKKI